MQTINYEPFTDSELEEEYQDHLEGVKKGEIFGAHEGDGSGALIMAEILDQLAYGKQLHRNYKKFLAFAIRAMLEGEDARKAFGLNSPPGRRASFELSEKVRTYVEEKTSAGIKKNKAIQAASEYFYKDPRHIQRLLQISDDINSIS